MGATNKMICPDCGREMNQHAEKIDYSVTPDELNETDADFGGVVEEVHSCPSCGKTETRRSE
jgi:predicted RNA-binding Zn-ribbon protein involved in translation (DUF1610 family)